MFFIYISKPGTFFGVWKKRERGEDFWLWNQFENFTFFRCIKKSDHFDLEKPTKKPK